MISRQIGAIQAVLRILVCEVNMEATIAAFTSMTFQVRSVAMLTIWKVFPDHVPIADMDLMDSVANVICEVCLIKVGLFDS
jgi:hypothetical protein